MIKKLGIIVGAGILMFFINTMTGETISILNPLAFLFMFGGSLFCLSITGHPIKFIKMIWMGVANLGFKKSDSIPKIVDRLRLFSKDFYSSSDNLERNILYEGHKFMSHSLSKAREGLLSGDELELVLSKRSQFLYEKQQNEIDNVANFLKYPALIGLLGCLFGLITYINNTTQIHPYLGSPGDIIEFSLLVTIYGFSFSYLFMQPLIERLETLNQNEFLAHKVIIEGAVMMRNRMNPLIISEILTNYTETKSQPSEVQWKQAI